MVIPCRDTSPCMYQYEQVIWNKLANMLHSLMHLCLTLHQQCKTEQCPSGFLKTGHGASNIVYHRQVILVFLSDVVEVRLGASLTLMFSFFRKKFHTIGVAIFDMFLKMHLFERPADFRFVSSHGWGHISIFFFFST